MSVKKTKQKKRYFRGFVVISARLRRISKIVLKKSNTSFLHVYYVMCQDQCFQFQFSNHNSQNWWRYVEPQETILFKAGPARTRMIHTHIKTTINLSRGGDSPARLLVVMYTWIRVYYERIHTYYHRSYEFVQIFHISYVHFRSMLWYYTSITR